MKLMIHLSLLDWLIIVIYAVVVITIGLRAGRKQKSSEGYFLAGRKLRWPFIGASLFAANISTEHFVGLAGSGFAIGMAIGGFEWIAVFCLIPLIVLFLPFYIKNKIYTVPEFLEKRFDISVRLLFSGFMMVLSVLAKISISLWASAIVFSEVLGWDKMTVIWIVGFLTAIYTMKGGLSAVVYTDAIQATVLLMAATILVTIGLHHVGGFSGLAAKIDPAMFSMIKPATDPDLPWPGMFFGVFLVGSFYFSMDQVLVQRVFAARDLNEGRLGAVFCAFLKTLTPLLLVFPGLIAKVLYPDLKEADQAYPTLLKNLMPSGLLGLTIAGITAALMGHLSATYNSIATLFTRDFYLKWRPNASQERQIFVGRAAVLVIFVMGALWAPIIGQFKSLWIYLQNVQAYLMMPFACIFFFAVLWKRVNVAGVLACMISAFILCPLMMFNNQYHFLPFMNTWLSPWLYGAMLACSICVIVLIITTLLTSPPPQYKLEGTVIQWRPRRQKTIPTQTESGVLFGKMEPSAVEETLTVKWYKDYRIWLTIVSVGTAFLWYLMR